MGTVPDPLRSAKLSLLTASEEKDHLGDLQSAKHQPEQPSRETASNGFSYTVSDSAGVCSFDLKCPAAADVQTCEKHHRDDASWHEAFSPGSFSKASEGHPAGVESASNSQPKACEELAVQALTAERARSTGHEPVMMPAPQNSCQFVQSSRAKSSSLAQTDDSALKPQGTDDQPALEVLNYSSPGNPIRDNESFNTSQANILQRGGEEKGAEKPGPAACQSASPERGTEDDLRRGPQVGLEAESRAANTVHSCPADQSAVVQSSKSPAQFRHESTQPVCNADVETVSSGVIQLSKFRETGTMTVQAENRSLTQEAGNRTWRDAEVQAVASVESKSASTSPSILAAFLKGNPPLEEKEELHIIYQGSGGLSQSELIDSFSSHQKSPCSSGIMPKSTVLTAVTDTAQTQAVKLQKYSGDQSDMVSPASADHTTLTRPCPLAAITSQGTSAVSAQMICAARDSREATLVPLDTPVLPKAVPVDQLAVNAGNQTPSQSGCGGPNTISAAVVPEIKSNVQQLVQDAGSSQLPLPCNTDREIKQKEVLDSSEQRLVQCKGVNEVKAIPIQSGVKPKEENLMVLDPKGVMNVSSEPAAISVKASSADTGEKGHGRDQGAISQALKASGRSLQAGLSSELSASSAHVTPLSGASAAPQQQGLQAEESRHELDTAALPTSAQALPNLGENKKQPTPAMEAKVQVKQSKHVRDVVWDEQGMTWEVYGASLDPESLGIAIQNHLQRQIREHEKLIQAQNTQNRKSISSDTSSNKKLKGRQHNVFQSMLQNFRRPNCCVRPAPSSVLD
ncbi:G protein-regulated inducer of neurite outgrowth 3 [Struthio camelus]|uniref:G protein-regulated inducer of neurite outgrowth 3 n=1 Tax=Struthio camelus TaxID=8801 RepID=UPI00051E421B|nr:PREDICTED: G protein-regulated inducer of neurite outgrowth 3 [Struthio camelus australis]